MIDLKKILSHLPKTKELTGVPKTIRQLMEANAEMHDLLEIVDIQICQRCVKKGVREICIAGKQVDKIEYLKTTLVPQVRNSIYRFHTLFARLREQLIIMELKDDKK